MLIVTGMSGAGRSTVGNALEDLGWYVVDNLPPQMLKPLVDLAGHTGEAIPKVAAMVDVRGGKLFADVLDALEILRRKTHVRVLFLDATDAALVRRFEQVRRPHPLQGDGTLLDGITAERARMAELRELSDFVIDTSELNIHQLATKVQEQFAEDGEVGHQGHGHELRVQVRAAARRRHGRRLPVPAEPVLDPGAARSHRPRRPRCATTCSASRAPRSSSSRYVQTLAPVLAGYRRENKRHATIAIGLHGRKAPLGRHRRGARAPAERAPRRERQREAPRPRSRVRLRRSIRSTQLSRITGSGNRAWH